MGFILSFKKKANGEMDKRLFENALIALNMTEYGVEARMSEVKKYLAGIKNLDSLIDGGKNDRYTPYRLSRVCGYLLGCEGGEETVLELVKKATTKKHLNIFENAVESRYDYEVRMKERVRTKIKQKYIELKIKPDKVMRKIEA